MFPIETSRKKKQLEFLNAQNLTRVNDLAHFFDKNKKFKFFLFFLLFPLYFIVFLLFVFCSILLWHSSRVTNSLLEKSWYKKNKLQGISCCRGKQNWKIHIWKRFYCISCEQPVFKEQVFENLLTLAFKQVLSNFSISFLNIGNLFTHILAFFHRGQGAPLWGSLSPWRLLFPQKFGPKAPEKLA